MRDGSSSSANADIDISVDRIRPHQSFGAGVVVSGHTAEGREISVRLLRASLREMGIAIGDEVPESTLRDRENADEATFAYGIAVALLGRRDHSGAELDLKLRKRNFSDVAIGAVLATCRERGYIDDGRYAEERLRSRLRKAGRSRRELVADLRNHGVSSDEAERAIRRYENGHPDVYDESLRRILAGMGDLDRVGRDRCIARLRRRGFSLQQILTNLP